MIIFLTSSFYYVSTLRLAHEPNEMKLPFIFNETFFLNYLRVKYYIILWNYEFTFCIFLLLIISYANFTHDRTVRYSGLPFLPSFCCVRYEQNCHTFWRNFRFLFCLQCLWLAVARRAMCLSLWFLVLILCWIM